MKRSKVDREQQALDICKAFLTNPLQQRVIAVMAGASDADLTTLGVQAGAVIGLIIKWGKRAMLGMASTDDLRRWFLNDSVPPNVQAFLVHVVAMVNK
jgi:hypothetical protein